MCLTKDYYIQDCIDPFSLQVMTDMCAPFTDEFYANGKYTWTFEISHDKQFIIQNRHWFSRCRIYICIQLFLTFLCRNFGSQFVIKYKKNRHIFNISFYPRQLQNRSFYPRMSISPSYRSKSSTRRPTPTVIPVELPIDPIFNPVESLTSTPSIELPHVKLHRQPSVFANPNDAQDDCRIVCDITPMPPTEISWANMVKGVV